MIKTQEADLEMRSVRRIKVGDKLLFHPLFAALGGESGSWFRKYAGMQAEVLGFDQCGLDAFYDVLAKTAGDVLSRTPAIGRLFVKFENGDQPDFSVLKDHFVVP